MPLFTEKTIVFKGDATVPPMLTVFLDPIYDAWMNQGNAKKHMVSA